MNIQNLIKAEKEWIKYYQEQIRNKQTIIKGLKELKKNERTR